MATATISEQNSEETKVSARTSAFHLEVPSIKIIPAPVVLPSGNCLAAIAVEPLKFPFSPLPEGMLDPNTYEAYTGSLPTKKLKPITAGIRGQLKNKVLNFIVKVGPGTPQGHVMFKFMMNAFVAVHGPCGEGIEAVEVKWFDIANWDTEYEVFKKSGNPYDTKTGKWVQEYGFTVAKLITEGEGHVVIRFMYPEKSIETSGVNLQGFGPIDN